MANLKFGAAVLLTALICNQATAAAPTSARDAAITRFNDMRAEVRSERGRKLGTRLALLENARQAAGLQRRGAPAATLAAKMRALHVRDGYVSISAYPDDPAAAEALRATLASKGVLEATVRDNAVTGRAPMAALADLAGTQGLRFLRPAMAKTNAGLVTSQGDRAQRSDVARRQFGVTGRGVRIGVLSDSYNCAEGPFAEGAPFTTAPEDIASKDLPADIKVLKDLSPVPDPTCTDEGRAMMQLMHDVAPGSSFAFYTAYDSVEDFAAGIGELVKAGANIIVDDTIYFEEPMFQDGPIAQAADRAAARGVAYFSSAGNQARQSYESRFRNSRRLGLNGLRHDFDPGRGVDTLQSITATAGSISLLSLQWDQPFFSVSGGAGSASDLDAYFVDADGAPIELCTDDPGQLICQVPGVDSNLGGDALEIPILVNLSDQDLDVQLAIELVEGPAPQLLKYEWFDLADGMFLVNEYATQSATLFGHANAARVEAVGAAAFYNTQAFGLNKPTCGPACLENFSSAGGVPILFDARGRRLAAPSVRLKPGITGPDGGDTTFFYQDLSAPVPGTDEPNGKPNFFGTSASVSHVAALGALLLEKNRRENPGARRPGGPRELSPDALYWGLRLTSQDIRARAGRVTGPFPIPDSRGYDFDSGFGFVDAVKALQSISGN